MKTLQKYSSVHVLTSTTISINQAPSRHSPGLQTKKASLRAKVGDDDIERRKEHATAIEQVSQGQLKIAQFTDSLATEYGQLFKALLSRLDVVEKEAFGLEPAAIDAAFQLKSASLSNRDSSAEALAFIARTIPDGHRRTFRRRHPARAPRADLRRRDS